MLHRPDVASCVRILTGAVVGIGLVVLAGPAVAERLVVAIDPPAVESNVYWLSGVAEPLPWMQSLVGNDPITGVYNDSGLARAWDVNEDLTEWTFYLHEDATFHFGWGPVTAADVVHSYEMHVNSEDSRITKARIQASSVEAVDDHTVVFKFDAPTSDYLFYHAGRTEMMIYSKAQFEAEGLEGYLEKPAGTGPYQLVERRMGQGTLVERVEDHWQGIVPDFEEIELRWAAEPATKLALLLSGEAHVADLPRELHADAIAQGKSIIASQIPAMHTSVALSGLYMVSGDPAFKPDLPWVDIRIREAMNRSLDRATMLDVLYGDKAKLIPRFAMDPRHEGYVPELEERFQDTYGYDPERARELLAEAGYPDAFPDPTIPIVSTVLAGNPEFGTLTELVQAYFEEIGLQTEIREMDFASLGTLGRAREQYLLYPTRGAPIRPSELGLVTFYTAAGSVYTAFQDDNIERLAGELSRTVDRDERNRLAAEAFTYLFDQYADIPIAAIHAAVTVDPTTVADWTFPGVTTNSLSHWHLIKAAK